MKIVNLPMILKNTELKYLEAAVKEHPNNHSKGAKSLKLKRTTYLEKLKRNGLYVQSKKFNQPGSENDGNENN